MLLLRNFRNPYNIQQTSGLEENMTDLGLEANSAFCYEVPNASASMQLADCELTELKPRNSLGVL